MRGVGGLVAAGMLLVACSGGGEPEAPEVEVVETDLDLSGPLVAVDDVLLSGVSAGPDRDEGETDTVYRSGDGGRRWEAVALPGAPAVLDLDPIGPALGGVGVVSGQSVEPSRGLPVVGDAFLWTTADGREWRGGRLAEAVGTSVDVQVAAAGDVLVAGVAVGGGVDRAARYELHRSVDGGASWTPATVPADLVVAPGGRMNLLDAWEAGSVLVANLGARVLASDDRGATWRDGICPRVAATDYGACVQPEAYGELLVRDREVSLDAGRTWQEPVVEADLPAPLHFGSVAELPDGGWVATGWAEDTDEQRSYVVRSRDGLRWEELRPGACEGGQGTPGFSQLVPFGDGWLTSHRCTDMDESVHSEVYTVEPDATRLEPVPGTLRENRDYAGATVVAGAVVVLVGNLDGPSEILRISP